jgi:hypothetical protein
MMLAEARADCVGKVIWNNGVADPGQRSPTHSPWATIVRPYGTFSLCFAVVASLPRVCICGRTRICGEVSDFGTYPPLCGQLVCRSFKPWEIDLGDGFPGPALAVLASHRLRNLGPLALCSLGGFDKVGDKVEDKVGVATATDFE